MGFCAMLLDFLGAKDCKRPLLSASYGWVIMQEWQMEPTLHPGWTCRNDTCTGGWTSRNSGWA